MPREVSEVVREIQALGRRTFFFIDDNLGADRRHLRSLLEALVPLRVRWVGQISLDAAGDPAILDLMQASGCMGVLIGFESLSEGNLASMKKPVNARHFDYGGAVDALRKRHIAVYATFLFGYPYDTRESLELHLPLQPGAALLLHGFQPPRSFSLVRDLYAELERSRKLLYREMVAGARLPLWRRRLRTGRHDRGRALPRVSCIPGEFHSAASLLRRGMDFRAMSPISAGSSSSGARA